MYFKNNDEKIGLNFQYLSKYGKSMFIGVIKEVIKDPTGMSFVYFIKSTKGVTYSSKEILLIP